MASNENPLPECPDSPNCERLATTFEADTSSVHEALVNALNEMGVHELSEDPEASRIDAVFRIPIFGFLDDVNLLYEDNEDSTTVYIRSASREGYSDLGVNSRRVKKLIRHTEKFLNNE